MKKSKDDILYTIVGGAFWVAFFVAVILGRWIIYWAR